MTGVSLAGTQLRANLYARQLYNNRWNDIEVITHYNIIYYLECFLWVPSNAVSAVRCV